MVGQLCRNANIPLAFQLLTVPVCDLHSVFTPEGEFDRDNCPYESYREMEFTPALPMARMKFFHRHFLGSPRPPKSEDVSDRMSCRNFLLTATGLEDIAQSVVEFLEPGSSPDLHGRAGSSAR